MAASLTGSAGARFAQNLRAALRWWGDELRAAFAPQIARWLADEATLTDLHCDGSALRAADGRSVSLAADDPQAVLAAMPATWKNRDVRLTLDSALVLQKRINYPAAAEENLSGAVGFDIDRQTPFSADQVYFHARVVARDAARAVIEVELTVVPRATLREALQALRSAGSRLVGIAVAGDRGSPPIDLLPAGERPVRRLTQMQKTNLWLLAAALLLGLLALWVPVIQKRETVKALIPEVQKAEAEAEVSRRVESDYTRLMGQYGYLTARKYANYTALEVVEELTKLTPDSAWINQMDMKTTSKAREVQLQGEATSASKMIELLEQSPLLQNATQRAGTTRGVQPNTERFNIATEVKPRIAPPLVTASALMTSAAAPIVPPVAAPAAVSAVPPVVPAATAAAPAPTASVTAPAATPSGMPPAEASADTAPKRRPWGRFRQQPGQAPQQAPQQTPAQPQSQPQTPAQPQPGGAP